MMAIFTGSASAVPAAKHEAPASASAAQNLFIAFLPCRAWSRCACDPSRVGSARASGSIMPAGYRPVKAPAAASPPLSSPSLTRRPSLAHDGPGSSPVRDARAAGGRGMNPDVVAAIARLKAANVLSAPQAHLFDRVARRDLVSVHFEIRALLYIGVLLLTSGVGLFLAEHREAIGPWAIAGAVGVAAACCLAWVVRHAPPFSWGEVASPSVAFDYVLLLGLLLAASDLAYAEAQFALLGPRWPQHLLLVGAGYLAAAYRWDSRTVLGLALTTLAAWRGVSISLVSPFMWRGDAASLRANAIAPAGVLYVAAAALSVRFRRKAHFEAVYANLGLLFLLGALASGAFARGIGWEAWLVALLAAAAVVVWVSYRLRRSLYFAAGCRGGLPGAAPAPLRAVRPRPERDRLPAVRAPGRGRARARRARASPDERAMRADSAAWDRAAEVRDAASGWRRAGAIDDATLTAIEAAFPDPCVTPTWIWRALTACLATAIGLCTLAAVLVATEPGADRARVRPVALRRGAARAPRSGLEASPRLARRGRGGRDVVLGVVLLPGRARPRPR